MRTAHFCVNIKLQLVLRVMVAIAWVLAILFSAPQESGLSCTAKTKNRNFETNIPRKGISASQSQFLRSCVCERFIYSHDRSPYSAGGNTVCRPILGYINRSQRHECWNWGWGRAIPRKGIYKGDFRCSVVCYQTFIILKNCSLKNLSTNKQCSYKT